MDPRYTIAAARPRDVPALGAIERSAAARLRGHAPAAVLEETTPAADLLAAQVDGRLLVALADDAPVGFVLIEMLAPDLPHLEEVDVHPDHGRCGVGTALVRAACEWAARAGHAQVTLTAFRSVPWDGPFYARLGFVEVAADALRPELAAIVRDGAARGLDPARRAVMRCWVTSRKTLAHYDAHADDFWEGTRDHDVSQNVAALLAYVEGAPPFQILDLGCGPGRDLRTFAALGHVAVGVDGAERFAAMARAHSGCEVWRQDFLALDLPDARFDGVFANAALFHVPRRELPRVLREVSAALKPGGVLFSSNPRGDGREGWNRGRYGVYHDLEAWRGYVTAAGFVELTHYYRPPGLARAQQPWLATVWRKPR